MSGACLKSFETGQKDPASFVLSCIRGLYQLTMPVLLLILPLHELLTQSALSAIGLEKALLFSLQHHSHAMLYAKAIQSSSEMEDCLFWSVCPVTGGTAASPLGCTG